MQELKHSDLLLELMEYAKGLGNKPSEAFTSERLFVALIDKIQSGKGGAESEELKTTKEIFCQAVPDLAAAREVLMARINVNTPGSGISVVYMGLKMQTAMRNCMEQKQEKVSVTELLKCILSDPTETIRKVLKTAESKKPNDLPVVDLSDEDPLFNDEMLDKIAQMDAMFGMGKGPETPPKTDKSAKQDMADLVAEVKNLRTQLKAKIFGQDNAIDVFVTGYFRARMLSMTDKTRRRPKATFLFAGPPGVGKTFLAETVAEALNMKKKFKVFDMSEYCDKEAAIEFCGSDAVYKNSKSGNLTSYLNDNPECILLFDEIEKAHISIIHLFLQILDAGRIRDNKTDKEISLKNVILIFTTNAGRKLYEGSEDGDLSLLSRNVVLDALRKDINPATGAPFFPAAICSRFASGNVVMFNHIKAHDLVRIAKGEIQRHTRNIQSETGLDIQIQDQVYSALLFSEGGDVDARTIRSRSETFINDELYELLRLIATDKVKTSIENVEKVKISVDLEGASPEIRSLFEKETSHKVLVLADEKTVDLIRSKLGKMEVVGVQTKADAIAEMKKSPADIAILDMRFGAKRNSADVLNIADMESPARDFHQFLQENRSALPVFIVEEKSSAITDEEVASLQKEGVRGVLRLSKGRDNFAKQVNDIVVNLYQQASLARLAGEKKQVSFETSQGVSRNGKTATIKLFDFKLSVAVESEDSKGVMSNVSKPNVKFDDVIGAKDAKSELVYFVNYLKNPHKYTGTGVKAPRGVLLYGPPGTGKTMLAKAMAAEAGVTFIAAEGNQFLKQYVGQGSEEVHKLFRMARKYAPAILFVDEIDAIAKERRGGEYAAGGGEATLTAFLAEMDGFSTDPSRPVFVLAATNFDVKPGGRKSLDPALMRRFDRKIYIDLPDKEGRLKFLKMRISKNPALQISEQLLQNIAMRSAGASLAELESAIELALRSAIRKGSTFVDDEILEEAFETYNNGEVKKWDESQLERVARHEAGHAFLCWESGETPSYLTIVARANHGGYMQHADQEGKAIFTKDELLAKIRTSLGGRAAEIVYYGEKDGVSTGASGDLVSATRMAQRIICAYGMDETFGLAAMPVETDAMTPEVRTAVNRILGEQMRDAIQTISENRDKIDALVARLMEKNHLTGPEIEETMAKACQPDAARIDTAEE